MTLNELMTIRKQGKRPLRPVWITATPRADGIILGRDPDLRALRGLDVVVMHDNETIAKRLNWYTNLIADIHAVGVRLLNSYNIDARKHIEISYCGQYIGRISPWS